MAAVARYLADTSALARLRHPGVAAVLAPLIESGVVATCGIIEFELRWATRSSAEFDQVRTDRDAGYEWLYVCRQDRGAAGMSMGWRRPLPDGVPSPRAGCRRGI